MGKSNKVGEWQKRREGMRTRMFGGDGGKGRGEEERMERRKRKKEEERKERRE